MMERAEFLFLLVVFSPCLFPIPWLRSYDPTILF